MYNHDKQINNMTDNTCKLFVASWFEYLCYKGYFNGVMVVLTLVGTATRLRLVIDGKMTKHISTASISSIFYVLGPTHLEKAFRYQLVESRFNTTKLMSVKLYWIEIC